MSPGSCCSAALKKVSPGKEHHDELRRVVELSPVALRAELHDVVAHLTCVILEPGFARRLVGGRLHGVQVRLQRRLGVHDDHLAAGQAYDEIGAQLPIARVDGGLLDEVTVVEHACHLADSLELNLPPATAHAGLPQRIHQSARALRELALRLRHGAHLLHERLVGSGARDLHALQRPVHLSERLADRGQQLGDRLLARGQVGGRRALQLTELRPGELQERFVVVSQRLGAQRLEAGAQPLLALFQQCHPALSRFALGRQALLRARQLHAGVVALAAGLIALGRERLVTRGRAPAGQQPRRGGAGDEDGQGNEYVDEHPESAASCDGAGVGGSAKVARCAAAGECRRPRPSAFSAHTPRQ